MTNQQAETSVQDKRPLSNQVTVGAVDIGESLWKDWAQKYLPTRCTQTRERNSGTMQYTLRCTARCKRTDVATARQPGSLPRAVHSEMHLGPSPERAQHTIPESDYDPVCSTVKAEQISQFHRPERRKPPADHRGHGASSYLGWGSTPVHRLTRTVWNSQVAMYDPYTPFRGSWHLKS